MQLFIEDRGNLNQKIGLEIKLFGLSSQKTSAIQIAEVMSISRPVLLV